MELHHGFTLIELSIGLVIIGLLIGGVLFGRDLIEGAAIRKQMSNLAQLDSNVNAFKMKFASLPGDMSMSKAAQFGLPYDATAQSGGNNFHNENGVIDQYSSSFDDLSLCRNRTGIGRVCVNVTTTYWGEPHYFMRQLYEARLSPYRVTSNTPSDLPNSAAKLDYGDGYLVVGTSTWAKGGYYLGMGTSNPASMWFGNSAFGAFTSAQAMQFDTKFDDGKPTTGIVRAAHWESGGYGMNVDYGPLAGGTTYPRNCVSGAVSAAVYDLTTKPGSKECGLWVQGQW
ncbi:MAG: prepilin-type N-terminal cleavage/methylation domain-containing protein [Planctomycetaceae bacterium]|nr:prepilin-type N-terminal cleavage/methylation domain-containing protein [Planctomycetaceae bacterium]